MRENAGQPERKFEEKIVTFSIGTGAGAEAAIKTGRANSDPPNLGERGKEQAQERGQCGSLIT